MTRHGGLLCFQSGQAINYVGDSDIEQYNSWEMDMEFKTYNIGAELLGSVFAWFITSIFIFIAPSNIFAKLQGAIAVPYNRTSQRQQSCFAFLHTYIRYVLRVIVIQRNRSDLVALLSLYCQPHTRWPRQIFCPVAVALNQ